VYPMELLVRLNTLGAWWRGELRNDRW